MDSNSLIDDLLSRGLSLEETHISWVFLGQDEAWKIKKPVSLGFLDFSTPENRKAACEAEVALNRRFSPRVYFGVTPVTRDAAGKHALDGDGVIVDWAVHMLRLPESDRLDRRLEAGRLFRESLRHLARRLAEFHAGASDSDTARRFGSPEAVSANVLENLAQAGPDLHRLLGDGKARELEAWQKNFLRNHVVWFQDRVRAGRIRDGHGDLRLDQIYLDDSGNWSILDCIEFNDRFRYGDVCADIAFLAMDLSAHGRRDLAENFLADYSKFSGDFDLYRMADFYQSYRACVRGKVLCLQAADPGRSDASRTEMGREALRRFFLAWTFTRSPESNPRLIAVAGIPGSGKSTVAGRLGEEWACPVIASDWTRKQMAGLNPLESKPEKAWEGLYAPAQTDGVYAEMLRRAKIVLESGRSAVVDATFATLEHRMAFRDAARQSGIRFDFLECRADAETCRKRLRARKGEVQASDAREGLLEEFQRRWEPVDPLLEPGSASLNTAQPLEKTWEQAEKILTEARSS